MVERNAGVPLERQIVFRIGIHLGDVVEENDGDLMGDGVNIAARLEGIAAPGAICLSEDAYRQVRGRLDVAVSDLGEQSLKNIDEPIRAYSLQVGVAAQAKPASIAGPAAPNKRAQAPFVAGIAILLVAIAAAWYFLGANRAPPAEAAHLSIVVLPFTNLSTDPSQDYFADGITENLTTDLSRIRNSFVIARNTAFTFKGKNVDAKEVGKELGVRYILEGSVQREQNRVRVNAQLIDAETGSHLWADRFEEDVADLFKLQDDIVARLANRLGYELVRAEAERGAHSKDPDAVDLTMRGWNAIWRGYGQPPGDRKISIETAKGLFDQALKIDAANTDALAGSAYAYYQDYLFGWTNAETDYEAKILGQADRAIALAPDNVRAYLAKGFYLGMSRRSNEALTAAEAGLAINPNFAPLLLPRINAELSLGRFEEAKADVQKATRLSPHDPNMGTLHVEAGDAELGLGHSDAAITEYHMAIDFGLQTFFAYTNLAAAYAHAGKMDEAKAALAEARILNPKLTVKWMIEHTPNLPAVFDGVRKAGLAEE